MSDLRVSDLTRARAEQSPAHPYLEDARSERSITYAAIDALISQWANHLEQMHVAPAGAVLIDVRDPLAFAVAHLSVIASGRCALPVDTNKPTTELHRLDDLIGGAAAVVSDERYAALPDALPGVPAIRVDTTTFLPSASTPGDRACSPAPAGDEGSTVLFTSGSTGTPKGVGLPESQLLFVAHGVAAHNRLTPADRGFNSLPLFHVNAEVVGLLATLVSGSTLVLDQSFHRTGFWELLEARRITWLNAVPAILSVLAKTGALDVPSRVRFIRCASAPLPEPIRAAFSSVPLVISWGMTEGASQIAATPLDAPARPGSVGVPIGAEVEVRDAAGTRLGSGEIGALWIRGRGVVGSYLFGRAAERFDAEGWLCTGDIGFVSADGWVSLVGRSDDVINRGGEKLYPAEIEEALLSHADALEVVVVPRPDEVLGAVPVAYVIIDADSDLDTDALHGSLTELVETRLARTHRPREIFIVSDLPRAATGKIQRSTVRDMAALTGIA